jgi:hypothetical protein
MAKLDEIVKEILANLKRGNYGMARSGAKGCMGTVV